jgi:serine/threonine protein kinase
MFSGLRAAVAPAEVPRRLERVADATPLVLTWTPGTVVAAYTLLREIARGGMGEIWLALHRASAGIERLVVIKRILGDADDAQGFATMFLDEARIAAQLHHPNVVQVFDLGEWHGSHYLVMEYLAGQSLGRVVRRALEHTGGVVPAVTAALAVDMVAAAAKGLGYAHRRRALDGSAMRVVHRDVSPQNLMVTYEGGVKVLDFGIAQATGRLTRTATGIVRGKIAYMSPEQAMGQPVGPPSDVFALGVILYELLTGTRLYQGADELEIMRRHSRDEPLPKLTDRRVDRALAAIVDRSLSVDPERRYEDGQALAEALHAWRAQHAGGESLEVMMHRLFVAEIERLPELDRALVLTPSLERDSKRSMPNVGFKPTRAPRGLWLLGGAALMVVTAALTWVVATRAVSSPAPALTTPDKPVEPPLQQEAVPPVAVQVDAGGADEALDVRPVVSAKPGRLTLNTEPWTRVMLGSKLLGDTPLVEVTLPAGRHRLRLLNPTEKVDTEIEVVIAPGATVVKKLSL